MSHTTSELPDADEADALEQAQVADGGLDDSPEDLDTDIVPDGQAARWDANEADVLEQTRTVQPGEDDEYPDSDEV